MQDSRCAIRYGGDGLLTALGKSSSNFGTKSTINSKLLRFHIIVSFYHFITYTIDAPPRIVLTINHLSTTSLRKTTDFSTKIIQVNKKIRVERVRMMATRRRAVVEPAKASTNCLPDHWQL